MIEAEAGCMRLTQSLHTFRLVVKEMLDFAGGTIVRNDGEALIIHVENEVLALFIDMVERRKITGSVE